METTALTNRSIWTLFALLPVLTVGLLTCIGQPQPAMAHPHAILKCGKNIKYAYAALINEGVDENGLYRERYDTNRDGKSDVAALSHVRYASKDGDVVQYVHATDPIFYLVDLDFDGSVDRVYIDKGPGGNCDDIVLYEDWTKPGEHKSAPNEQRAQN